MGDDRRWRRIGWDGILLQVPTDWHPAAVYTDYMLFEEEHQPIFALKWQQIKGRFEPGRIFKKLKKSLGRSELTPWQIPPNWCSSLKPFLHQGFQWHGDGGRGTGLLLYCRESRRALLLQFYGKKNCRSAIFGHLLANLQPRQREEQQIWSVFDISIQLPKEVKLTEHEFLPGSFRLQFTLPDGKLTFYRFKPAAELLRKHSLSEFGSKIAAGALLQQGDDPLQAQWQQDPGPGRHLLERLRRKPACSTVRLWQIPEKNVILGLKAQSNRQIPEDHFKALCSGYTTC